MSDARTTGSAATISPGAARLSMAAAITYQATLIALIFIRPDLDPSWHTISEWAIGPHGWVMNTTMIPLMDDPGRFRDDYTRGLQAHTGKTLFLSDRCSFIGYEFQERYHRPRFPSGTLHRVIEGTGHNMFTLKPVESLEAIRPFLREPDRSVATARPGGKKRRTAGL